MNVYIIQPPDPCEPVLAFRDLCDAHDYAGARWPDGDWSVEEAPLIGHGEARQMTQAELAGEA